jgi:POT family proton-dependent oligopeptide transporter
LRVVWSALTANATGLAITLAGVALGVASFWLDVPLVAKCCLWLVCLLVFGGIGTSLQLELARGRHPDDAIDGVRAVLRILIVFAFVTPFWSLFDQKASTWVLQANAMDKPDWFEPAQMQLVNPALVMLLIPFNNLVLFPWLRRRGYEPTPLRRMTSGIAFAGFAWIVVASMQLVLDSGAHFHIAWQIVPYALLTLGEVLVSATGLEFAYSQAPPTMKGVIMAFWSLCVTVGNLWVIVANASIKSKSVLAQVEQTGLSAIAFLMFFFAAFALVAAAAFGIYARRYRMVDHYRA